MRYWKIGLSVMLGAALVAPSATIPAQTLPTRREGGVLRLGQGVVFKTEASKVLSALAHLAKAGIVLPEDIKTVVTVNLSNMTIDEAFRIVAAQAKVAYRKVGNAYIVAPVESMQKVMELQGVKERIPLQNITAEAATTALTKAVPFVTVRPAGASLILIGAPEDLEEARNVLQSLDTALPSEPVESVSMTLTYIPSEDVQALLTSQFTGLKAQKVGDRGIAFSGPRGLTLRAQEFIRALDKGKEANARYVVYQTKYVSPSSLVETLTRAIQNITVVTGPEPYYIPRPQLNLTTANSLGSSSSGSGGGGLGGGSGGSSSGGSFGGSSSGGGGGGGDTGGGLGGGQTGTGGGQGANSQLGERTRAVLIGGPEDTVKAALKLLEQLDVPTPQVVLDVKVVSTNPQTTQNLGIDWSNGGQGSAASVSTTVIERPSTAAADIPGAPLVRNSFGIGNFGRLPIQFSATLNAFFRRDDVRILAKPTITALDNESGVVFVGETRRVSVSTIPTGLGTNNVVLNNVVEIPVGIILQMRPRINEGDQITLKVHPIYSSVGAVDARTGLFSTFTREADTTVRVKSGETIVIGGLLQEEDTRTLIKIPILGDIPLIGQFFRNYTRTHLRREVLVFVTPHLIKE